jgi:uncharacterized protein (TIGR03437 family)
MLYAGGSQLNVQVPFGFTGDGTLQVTTPNGSDVTQVRIVAVAPAIFENPSLPGIAMAMHADQSLITPDAPAAPGEWIDVAVTGLGAVAGNCQAGVAPQAQLPVVAPVAVSFAGAKVPATAATSPNAPGMYYVQVQVPARETAAIRGTVPTGGTVAIRVVSGISASGALQLPLVE